MKSFLFACLVALLWSIPKLAQLSDMNQWLNSGTEKQRIHRLVSLGVRPDTAALAVSERDIEWLPIRSESGNETAIMFFPCDGMYSAYLYVLKTGDKGSHVTDRAGFDCHYDNSVSVEITSTRYPNVDDVFVHHACEGHGTGFVQQNFNVFAVRSGKFELVLNTEEVLDAWPTDGREMHQRSTFAALPTIQSGSPVIAEKRCISDGGKVTKQKRQFEWSPTAFRFQPSSFTRADFDKEDKVGCR